MKYKVYKTINTLTGEMYIGRYSTDAKKDSYLGSGVNIKNQIKEYGRDIFTKEILLETDDLQLACDTERDIINHYMDNHTQLCMNVYRASGKGFTGNTHSEEYKANISESTSGAKNPMYGKTGAMKGKFGEKHHNSKAVIVEGIEYGAIWEASRQLEISQSTIGRRCKSTSPKYKDWYYKETGPVLEKHKHGNSKEVIIEGEEYGGVREAARYFGVSSRTVTCRCRSASAKFKHWNYKE